MGARAAVVTATETHSSSASSSSSGTAVPMVKALVLVSYPLTAASKGDVRDQILLDLPSDIDVLFISGGRDSMCDLAQLREVREKMNAKSWLVEVKGADHGMDLKPKPKKGDGKGTVEVVRKFMGEVAARWVRERHREGTRGEVRWDEEEGSVGWSGWREEG